MDQYQLGVAFAAAHLAELRRQADQRRLASRNRRVQQEETTLREAHGWARAARRRAGSFSEQFALLFRDFLRADPAGALDYGEHKVVLAARFTNDRQGYLEAKVPIIWDVLRRADRWAQATGWEPGPSDA